MTKRMPLLAVTVSRILCCTFLCAAFLSGHPSPYLEDKTESQKLARRFQDAAVRSMRDGANRRARTIDLYWRANVIAGSGKPLSETRALIGELYRQLESGRIVHAELDGPGWNLREPAEPLIVVAGKPFDDLLLVVSNRTDKDQVVRIGGNVLPESVALSAGASTGLFVRVPSRPPGRFRCRITVRTRELAGEIPIQGEARPAGRLAASILDPAGKPTAARIYLRSADGFSHVPKGSRKRVMWMSGEHYFHADGYFEAELPEGLAEIEAVKGFVHRPQVTEVRIEGGKTTRAALRLTRLEDVNAQGWYSGDEHIHGNYRGYQTTDPAGNFLEIRAEDLNVANLVVSNSDGTYVHDEQYFDGGRLHPLSTPKHVFSWNQEMRNRNLYGHLIFLNLKELVRPIYTGFPGTPNWEDYPANYHQAKNAKAQGGAVSYAHPALLFDRPPTGSDAIESVVDVALGLVDALEVFCSHDEPSMALWYSFLNLGFHLGIAAGSDAFINQDFAFVAGGVRSYVNTGKEFDYAKWVEGLRAGRAFATVGPLLFFEVEDQLPGHQFQFERGPVELRAVARVTSIVPVRKLEIVANGRVVGETGGSAPVNQLEWNGRIALPKSAWIAARVWGPDHRLIANSPSRFGERRNPLVLMAHSGASYVSIAGRRVFSEKDRALCLTWIDALLDNVKRRGQFATQARRQEVIDTFVRVRSIYERMGE
jgi:hypothetical protein